ncbi:MAG: FAD-binding oxidoreductase, partial [Acidobacteria bacterium]|nr:FAD-binding oxidoreductase [Acidobacteriota bacterium]
MTASNLLSKLATIGDGPIADSEAVARYATDVTRNYHGQPIAVMRPRTTEEVAAIV